jgi:outer membrane protein OmpA-like peptidoglycan-associated protein
MKNVWLTLFFGFIVNVILAQDSSETRIQIHRLKDSINSIYSEFSPCITADGKTLFFTSRKPNELNPIVKKQSEAFENVYMSIFDFEKGNWSNAILLEEPINTKGKHCSAIAISNDGQRMLLYRDDPISKGDIYESILDGDVWSEPIKLPFPINSNAHESSASFSPDGNTIYFVSDREKKRKRDIYFATKSEAGIWSEAVCLFDLNSSFNEEAVFMHPDGKTLYFSSDRPGGVGGYDIYFSTKKNNAWSFPKNMQAPINSTANELFYVLTANGKKAYYSSSQTENSLAMDLYEVAYLPTKTNPEKSPDLVLLKGKISDQQSFLPLEAQIEITNLNSSEKVTTIHSNRKTGDYLISLPSGINYGIFVSANNYLHQSKNIDIPDDLGYMEIVNDFHLMKYEIGSKIILNNLFFDFGKATLTETSLVELQKITLLLKENPKLKIELSGHTDSRGNKEANQVLSENRAKTVYQFLIDQGIQANRLNYKGYGEEQPIYPDQQIISIENKALQEKMHAENRRMEFKILEVGL